MLGALEKFVSSIAVAEHYAARCRVPFHAPLYRHTLITTSGSPTAWSREGRATEPHVRTISTIATASGPTPRLLTWPVVMIPAEE